MGKDKIQGWRRGGSGLDEGTGTEEVQEGWVVGERGRRRAEGGR